MPDEKITWELLKQLGLDITPHSDPSHGWGYTWQGRDWVGPFTTPAAALHAAFTDALLALQFRSEYSWADLAQPGELWRFDGDSEAGCTSVDLVGVPTFFPPKIPAKNALKR